MRPTTPRAQRRGLRRLVKPLLAAVLVGGASLPSMLGHGSSASRAGGTDLRARPVAATSGQITAGQGQFWLNGEPITLRGVMDNGVGVTNDDLARMASWGMNLVRLTVNWSRLEPNPPVKNADGTWTHTYSQSYVQQLQQDAAWASQNGLWVVFGQYPYASDFFGYPDWLYQKGYNSKKITYAETTDGYNQAETDFWSDSLRQQFMSDMWQYLAGQLAPSPGILGYEVLNEPQKGNLPVAASTTATTLSVQLQIAKAIRAADPNRVIFFTTHEGFGPGLPQADLSGWQSLGNVAFDLHDYFGARWGDGLIENPSHDGYQQQSEDLFNNTSTNGVPSYEGTTVGQMRFVQMALNSLAKWGIPLMMGEFGDTGSDPGVDAFFGTTTSAFNYLNVSWAVDYGPTWGITNNDDTLKPFAQIVIDAAAAPTGPQ